MKLNRYLFNMKPNEFNDIVENAIALQIKMKILEQVDGNKKTVFHIKCDGEPVDTFKSKEEADEHLDKYKKDHPGKQFIVEPETYDSESNMLDKLDEMGEELEENSNINMKKDEQNIEDTSSSKELQKKPIKVKTFAEAVLDAKNRGLKKIKIGEEIHDVHECWKQLEEDEQSDDIVIDEENDCVECGSKSIEEDDEKSNDLTDMYMNLRKNNPDFFNEEDINEYNDDNEVKLEKGKKYKYSTPSFEDDIEFDLEIPQDKGKPMYKFKGSKGDNHLLGNDHVKKHVSDNACEKCGEEVCECDSMNESKKKTVRLSETELIDFVTKIVLETKNAPYTKTINTPKQKVEREHSGVPGLAVTKNAQTLSKNNNDDNMSDVDKKLKDYLSFDGNDNPEFPKAIGKGDKVGRENSKEQDEEVAKNFAGLQNLDYDIEPDDKFKDRLKKGIEGDTTMGNAPVSKKLTIKTSNGAESPEESEHDGNVIKTPETAKKIEKQVKDRQEDKDNRVLYPKEKLPVKINKSINEDIEKIKNLYQYNKKTQ